MTEDEFRLLVTDLIVNSSVRDRFFHFSPPPLYPVGAGRLFFSQQVAGERKLVFICDI